MHWLLLLAVLSSTTGLKNASPTQMNRLAESALRQKLGGAGAVRVAISPGKGGGDFNAMTVSLDGFSADSLARLDPQTDNNSGDYGSNTGDYADPNGDGDPNGYDPTQLRTNRFDWGDVLGKGGLGKGDLGSVLGGVLGGNKGRIGRLHLRATNFSFGGARYDSLSADLGEIRFDWAKALRGNFDVKSVQPGTLALQLRGDQLARLLAPRLPSLRDLRVRFADGRAFVGGRANSYGLNVPFEVGARLSVEQNQVRADGFQASVSRLRLPGFVLDELTRGVNPLYDFDPHHRWPLAVNLQTAGTTSNALSLRGGIEWLGLNRDRQSTRNDRRDTRDDQNTRYPDDGTDNGGTNDNADTNPQPRDNSDVLGDILGGVLGH